MNKMWKRVFALMLCCCMMFGSGCSGMGDEILEEMGLPQEEIDIVKDAAQQALDQLNAEIDVLNEQMNVLLDELADLIIGSDEAYHTVTTLYESTRLPGRYDRLASKSIDGRTIWNAQTPGTAERLGKLTDASGAYTLYYGDENPYSKGQCTWYAYGRFWEDNGIALGGMNDACTWLDGTDAWVKQVYRQENPDADMSTYQKIDGYLAAGVFVSRGEEKVYPHSIAVCTSSQAAGHVVYIEDVTYEDGVPVTVWFSEANWKGTSGKVDEWDGLLQQMPYQTFCEKRSVLGYIVPTYFLK